MLNPTRWEECCHADDVMLNPTRWEECCHAYDVMLNSTRRGECCHADDVMLNPTQQEECCHADDVRGCAGEWARISLNRALKLRCVFSNRKVSMRHSSTQVIVPSL